MVVVRASRRFARSWTSWGLVVAALLIAPSAGRAQVFPIFNSNGFESPTFTPGILASYFSGGTGGQQGFLTTDFSQLLGTPAGNVQTAVFQSGAQAFHVDGPRLFNDTTFSGQTFWYRNYPTAATAFNPVAAGFPVVNYNFSQRVTSTPTGVSEMPLVGVYMEGYSQAGSQQQVVGSILFNLNGGVTAITVGGNAVNTANNIVSHDAWHDFQVSFNFASQTYRAWVDGNLMTFGGGLTDVPFRNTNGVTDRIAEYGFQASYNTAAMSTTNHAYFDGFGVVATVVPEPSSILLLSTGAGLGILYRKRRRR